MIFEGRNPAREELVQLIKEHDKDGNGTIGVVFRKIGHLKQLKFQSKKKRKNDNRWNEKPLKDFEEFIIMMTSKMDHFEDDDEIKEIFR